MDIKDFIAKFAEQFFETPADVFNAETEFRQIKEWSSMTGLCVLSMIKDEFGFFLDPAEFRKCNTIQEVYNAVTSHL